MCLRIYEIIFPTNGNGNGYDVTVLKTTVEIHFVIAMLAHQVAVLPYKIFDIIMLTLFWIR